jgi:exonuclease III
LGQGRIVRRKEEVEEGSHFYQNLNLKPKVIFWPTNNNQLKGHLELRVPKEGYKMKIMSFNCRGLANPHKKLTLKRVVINDHPDVILLQDTLGDGEVVQAALETMFPGWAFITSDVRGRSGGLVVGWNSKTVKILNSWGLDSCLGIELISVDLGMELHIFNIYGPYQDRVIFWEDLFNKSLLGGNSIILGGDFNFSLGLAEVFGASC